MTPTCILFPKTPADVVQIVKLLGTNDEKFAVKGGGHMPNVLFNE
jgi:FAD/FMN-containing dehydrogenase